MTLQWYNYVHLSSFLYLGKLLCVRVSPGTVSLHTQQCLTANAESVCDKVFRKTFFRMSQKD